MKISFACLGSVALLALSLVGGVAAAAELPAMTTDQAASADAKPGAQATAARLKQDAVCTRCHDENENKPLLAIYQTRHGVAGDPHTPSCQGCHGLSDDHVAGGKAEGKYDAGPRRKSSSGRARPPSPAFGARGQEACLACHKAGNRTFLVGSPHQNRDVVCCKCHTVHVAADAVLAKATQAEVCFACHKTQRAQTHHISTHPINVGQDGCSGLPQPAWFDGPKLLVKDTVNETCYTCHAEKRGPFLWEHSPVVDDCTNCHTPHGSTNPPLLKTRVPSCARSATAAITARRSTAARICRPATRHHSQRPASPGERGARERRPMRAPA